MHHIIDICKSNQQLFFPPHLIALNASVSHGGCWSPGKCWGPPLLGLSLGRHPGYVHDGLRLAQGAGPIFYAGDTCGQTLWEMSKIKEVRSDLINGSKQMYKSFKDNLLSIK